MSKKTRKLGLVGYFGYGNYGDELFLDVYRKFFYDCELVVLPDSPKNPVYGSEFHNVGGLVSHVDAILIGGGDLFIPKYYANNYFQDVFLSKPIYYHGVGVPLWIGQDPEVINKMSCFLQHGNVKRINVRDQESLAWVRDHLKPTAPIDFSSDMVFSLDFPRVEKDNDPKIFGVITRKGTPGTVRWDRISALCDRARYYGYTIHNIVLGTGVIRDDDLIGLKEWNYAHMTTIDPNDIHELTKEIARCSVVASTKFHGCVVSMAYGIPAVTMTTTDKFLNLYKAIDRKDLISHFLHDDLVTHLSKYMAPIPHSTRNFLRQDSIAGMQRLRCAVLDEIF